MSDRQLLTGWGRTAPSAATVACPRDVTEVVAAVASAPARGVIARGLGRSYGDAAQLAGGLVLDLTSLDRIEELDLAAGWVRAGAGLSLDRLIREVLPHGWFVPVTPGTRFVTLGGALAADIHGKNHHLDGTFAAHVRGFELVTGAAEVRWVDPGADADVFWATAGGMGLTGVITAVELELRPVTTARIVVDTERAADLDDLLSRMTARDHLYPYSVAWLDTTRVGPRFGRGVLTRGRHADVSELDEAGARDPLAVPASRGVPVLPWLGVKVVSRATVSAFNELWYRRAPRDRRDELQNLTAFFHPLDGVLGWNRLYGRQGLVQYQMVVPGGAVDTLQRCLERVARAPETCGLAVLKRFGPANPGPLSFPIEGWTLALDFPATPSLRPLVDGLDELVVEAGGRIYLAKDARLPSEHLRAMYPRLPAFREAVRELDPESRFRSDLARRLGL